MNTCDNASPIQIKRARVRCLGVSWQIDPLSGPSSQLPFLNRPFIHHLTDILVDRGVEEIEFVCGSKLDSFTKVMGNGERWGIAFRFVESSMHDSQRDDRVLAVAGHSLPLSSERSLLAPLIRVDSPAHYLAAQNHVMKTNLRSRVTVEKEIEPGIWIGRNVRLHRSAKLEAPVLIGENSRVAAGVHLGPATVIGANCVIERNSTIRESTVMPGVFLGEGLELFQTIVHVNRIVNARIGTSVPVNDRLMVSHVAC